MANSTLNIPLFTTLNDKGIQDALKGLRSLGDSLQGLSKKAIGAYTGFELLSKSVNFVSSSINAARDLQRNMAGLTTIFGASTGQMAEFVKTSESMGMSQAAAAKATTFLGSVFKQTGMPMDKVISQTKTMVSLGADLASTYGYSVDEALTAMTATFRGEYDPIEKFGVAMKQQQVNAELAAMGLGKLKGQALIAAQQQVRYNMILERTSDAQGAFARQSGNLFEQQQILQAVFTDMKATLGQALTPAFTNLLSALQPVVQTLGPSLVPIFESLGTMILQLVPHLETLGKDIAGVFEGLGAAFELLGPVIMALITFMVDNLPSLLTFMAVFKGSQFVLNMVTVFKELRTAIMGATAAQVGFNVAMDANPIGIAVLALSSLVGWLVSAKTAYDNAATSAGKLAAAQADKNYARNLFLNSGAASALQSIAGYKKVQSAAGAAADAARYTAREAMGMALGLNKVFTPKTGPDVVDAAAAAKAAAKAAAAARKAAAEAARIQKEVVAASTAMAKQISDALKDVVTETTKTYDQIVSAAENFVSSYNDVINNFRDLTNVAPKMGAFEAEVTDAFTNLIKQADAAKDAKLIDEGTLADLKSMADKEKAILAGIAKQRDIITEKIAIARNITSAIYGYADITGVLKNVTETVTQTSTQIIDGVTVTLTKSVEAVKATDIVGEYQKILDKTKAFATNLKALKAAGLDQNLFKQIVDAGVESGGATAAAIIAGGGNTITELNNLFADLQTTGSDIAATTTDVMYAAGQDITTGFIGGLISESEALRKAAADMATSFSDTFTSKLMSAMNAAINAAKLAMENAIAVMNTVQTPTPDYSSYIQGATEGLTGAALQKQLNMLSGADVSAPGSFMNTLGYMSASQPTTSAPIVLQVDGKTLATSMLTYERTNGNIWVRAL